MKYLENPDRSALLRKASQLDKGSEERRAILADLRKGEKTWDAMLGKFGEVRSWARDEIKRLEAEGDVAGLEVLATIEELAQIIAEQVRHDVEPVLRRAKQQVGDEERRILDGIKAWAKSVPTELKGTIFNASNSRRGVTTIDAQNYKGTYFSNILKGAVDTAAIANLIADGRLQGSEQRGTFRFTFRG